MLRLLCLQALEETKMNQVRIITELEKEKKKMQDDVLKLKEAKVTGVNYEAVSSFFELKSISCENC